jgi:hypothetical protein
MQYDTRRLAREKVSSCWAGNTISLDNQLLFHIGIADSSPIRHLLLAFRMNLEPQMLRHTKLGCDLTLLQKNYTLDSIFALSSLAISVYGFVRAFTKLSSVKCWNIKITLSHGGVKGGEPCKDVNVSGLFYNILCLMKFK